MPSRGCGQKKNTVTERPYVSKRVTGYARVCVSISKLYPYPYSYSYTVCVCMYIHVRCFTSSKPRLVTGVQVPPGNFFSDFLFFSGILLYSRRHEPPITNHQPAGGFARPCVPRVCGRFKVHLRFGYGSF